MAGKGGGVVRVTRRGWVRAGGSGPEVGTEGAGPEGRESELSGSEVGEGDGAKDEDLAGIVVKSGRGSCIGVSTQIAML